MPSLMRMRMIMTMMKMRIMGKWFCWFTWRGSRSEPPRKFVTTGIQAWGIVHIGKWNRKRWFYDIRQNSWFDNLQWEERKCWGGSTWWIMRRATDESWWLQLLSVSSCSGCNHSRCLCHYRPIHYSFCIHGSNRETNLNGFWRSVGW